MANQQSKKPTAAAPAPATEVTKQTEMQSVSQEQALDTTASQEKPVEQFNPTGASGTEITNTSEQPGAAKEPEAVVKKEEVVEKQTSIQTLEYTASSQIEEITVFCFNEYIEKMRPGLAHTPVSGAVRQTVLWQAISNAFELSTPDEFNSVYSKMLSMFKEHRDGVFNERYVMRFMEEVTMDANERFAFQAIVNLMRKTCDPLESKQMLKQVDMGRTLAQGFSEQARQKVLAFYNM
jgi:hypothetical protein